jgi:hypothetical protein
MRKTQAKYKKVIVKWLDAFTDDDKAVKIEDALKMEMPLRESIGYLLKKDRRRVVLAMIYDHEDQEVDGIHIIPRQWAMEINEIK